MSTSRPSSRALPVDWTKHLPKLVEDRTGRGKTQWMRAVLAQVQYFSLSRTDKITVREFLAEQTGASANAVMRVVLSCRSQAASVVAEAPGPVVKTPKAAPKPVAHVPAEKISEFSLRKALLAGAFVLLLGMQVVQWRNAGALQASLIDAHKLLEAVRIEALKRMSPVRSNTIVASVTPDVRSTASLPPAAQQIVAHTDERRAERILQQTIVVSHLAAPRQLPSKDLPGISTTNPTVRSLLALLDKGQEGQVLMSRNGKIIWADVTQPGGGGTIRDTGGRRPIPAGEERTYGGSGPIQVISTPAIHHHSSDSEGGQLDILAATLGTLTSGRGGTGFDTYAAGDLLVGNSTHALQKLALGTTGYVLTSSGGTVTWQSAASIAAAGGWADDGSVVRLTSDSDRVAIGTVSPVNGGKLTISTASGSGPAIVLTGSGCNGCGGPSSAGVFIGLGVNYYNNRQLIFGNTDTSGTGSVVRMYFYNGAVGLDAVTRNGAYRRDLVIGTDSTNLAIGNTAGGFTMPGGIKTIFYSEATKVSVAIRAASAQTGSLLQFQNSAGTVLSSIDQNGQLAIGKTAQAQTALDVVGTISGSALTISSLRSCALITTNANGVTSCGSAFTSGTADSRYVNVSGDTMTGALTIQNGNTHSATSTALLNVRGTMSGRSIYISGTGSSPLLVTNITTGRVGIGTSSPGSKLEVQGGVRLLGYDIPTSGEGLEMGYNGTEGFLLGFNRTGAAYKSININNTLYALGAGNVGVGTSAPKTKLDVVGTISGSALVINGTGKFGLGSAATPSISFFSKPSTGFYNESDELKASQNGVAVLRINAAALATLTDTFNMGANDGTAGLRVFSPGVLRVTSGGNFGYGTGSLVVGAYDTSTPALRIRGVSGLTANLTEWKNGPGTTLSSMSQSGWLAINSANKAKTALEVAGTISGSTLYASDAVRINSSNANYPLRVVSSQSTLASLSTSDNTSFNRNVAMGFDANGAFSLTYERCVSSCFTPNDILTLDTTGLSIGGADHASTATLDVVGTISGASINTSNGYFYRGNGILKAPGTGNLFVGNTGDINSGTENTAVGYKALNGNSTGIRNTAVGEEALLSLLGSYNATLGFHAGYNLSTGTGNIFLGANADATVGTLTNAIAIGYNATVGANNTLRLGSGANVIVGSRGTAKSTFEVQGTISGSALRIAGTMSGASVFARSFINTNTSYQIGGARILHNTGTDNIFVGESAGPSTTGASNTAVGKNTLFSNGLGAFNVAIGTSALYTNGNGSLSTAVGAQALLSSTGGSNTAVGYSALSSNIGGTHNVAVGNTAGTTNTTGLRNIFIGYNSDATANNLTNAIAIGASAKVGASNTLRLGSGTNVIIGDKTTANTKLEVQGTISGTALTVSSLRSCALIVTDASGNTSCGSSATLADSRFVNVSGDTMTGALTIQNGNTHSSTATALLNVRGTMSGRSIYISGTGSSPVLITSASTGRVGIGTSAPDAQFTVLNSATINNDVSKISSVYNIGANALLNLNYSATDAGRALLVTDTSYNTGGISIVKTTGGGAANTNIAGMLITATYTHTDAGFAGSIGNGARITATNNTATAGRLYGMDLSATANTATAVGLRVVVSASSGTGYAALFNGGNVGIGTASPGAKLHVTGGNIFLDANTGIYTWGTSPTASLLSIGYVNDNTGGNYIKTAGGSNDSLDIGSKNTGYLAFNQVSSGTSGNNQDVRFYGYSSKTGDTGGKYGLLKMNDGGVSNFAYLSLETQSSSYPLALQPTAGNVGIGKTAPSTKLDVVGTISGSALRINGDANVKNGSSYYIASAGDNTSDAEGFYFLSNKAWGLRFSVASPNFYTDLLFDSTGGSGNNSRGIRFIDSVSGGTQIVRMMIGDTGNVGVGKNVTSPGAQFVVSGSTVIGNNIGSRAAKAQLDVVGTISGTGLRINGTLSSNTSTAAFLNLSGAGRTLQVDSNGVLQWSASASMGPVAWAGVGDFEIYQSGGSRYGLFVSDSSPAAKAAVIRGAASQSANLLEFQNSAATALTSFSSSGWLAIGKTGSAKTQLDVVGTISGSALTINGTQTVFGNIVPGIDNRYDLGTNSTRWKQLYLSGGSLHIGTSTLEGKIGYVSNGSEGLTFFGNSSTATPAIMVSSGGLVGIGTATPLHLFDISGSNTAPSLTSNDSAPFTVQNGSMAIAMGTNGTGNQGGWIQVRHSTLSGNSYPLLLNPVGNYVGIATLTPKAQLDVSGTISGSGLQINGAGNFRDGLTVDTKGSNSATLTLTGISPYSANVALKGYADSTIDYYGNGSTTTNSWRTGVMGNFGYSGNFVIYNMVGAAPSLFINASSNNVGIGTTSPKAKLDVVGTISGTALTITSTSAQITFDGSTLGRNIFKSNGSVKAEMGWSQASQGGFGHPEGAYIAYDNLYLGNYQAGNPSMSVLSTGYVIIGSKTTATAKLDVVGTISGSLITQNGAGSNYFMGNVGIGTTTPKAQFEVVGTISGSALTVNGNATVRGYITSPGIGSSSEKFGLNSTASGASTMAMGNGATGASANSIVIGTNAVSTRTSSLNVLIGNSASIDTVNYGSVAVGYASVITGAGLATAVGGGASAANAGAIAIGNGASTAGDNAITIGRNATTTYQSSIVLGYAVAATAANQLVIGSSVNGYGINDVYLGNGVSHATPIDVTLQSNGGAGSNIAGGALRIAGGKGTGSAYGGSIVFLTTTAGSAGSSLNTLAERMRVTASGSVGIGTTSPKAKIDVVGTISGSLVTQNGAGNNYFRGNVGIGTTTPASALDVYAATAAEVNITAADASTSTLKFNNQGYSLGGYLQYAESSAHMDLFVMRGLDGGSLRFGTQQGEAMRIINNRVGIGSTAPGVTFEVAGSGAFTGTTSRVSIGKATAKAQLDVVGTISGSSLTLNNTAAATKILKLRGASNQTANYFEVQNATGSSLLVHDTNNFFTLYGEKYGTNALTGNIYMSAGKNLGGGSYYYPTFYVAGANANQYANIGATGLSTSTDQSGISFSATFAATRGLYYAPYEGTLTLNGYTGNGIAVTNNDLIVSAATAGIRPMVIKGAAAQTANLTEWQNSAGAALSFITPSGSGSFKSVAIGKTPVNGRAFEVVGTISGSALKINSPTAANTLIGTTNIIGANPSDYGGNIQLNGDYVRIWNSINNGPLGELRFGYASSNDVKIIGQNSAGLSLYTNNAVAQFINESGFVGINTVTPKARFTVVGSGAFTGTLSGSALNIQGGTSYIRGNLGIGTATPSQMLDVYTTGTTAQANITIDNAGSDGVANLYINSGGVSGSNGNNRANLILNTSHSGCSQCANVIFYEDGAGKWLMSYDTGFDRLAFYKPGDAGTVPSITFLDTGNVGIGKGNASPGAQFTVSGSTVIGNNIGSRVAKAQLDVVGTISGSLLTMSNPSGTNYLMGNVGIGTMSPSTKLEVADSLQSIQIPINRLRYRYNADPAATYRFQLYDNFAGVIAGTGNSPGLALTSGDTYVRSDLLGLSDGLGIFVGSTETNPTEMMRINSSGNVGIGSTAPKAKLDVVGTISGATLNISSGYNQINYIGGKLAINKIGNASAALEVVGAISGSSLQTNGNITPGMDNRFDLGTNSTRWRQLYLSGGSLHIGNSTTEGKIGYTTSGFEGMTFFGSGGNTITPHMLLSSGGFLGVGSTTPSARLHVRGTNQPNGNIALFETPSATGGFSTVQLRHNVSGGNDIYGTWGADNNGVWFGGESLANLRFYSGGAQRAVFDTTGNFAIGKAAATTKLDVAGTISGSALLVNGTSQFNGLVGIGMAPTVYKLSVQGTDGSNGFRLVNTSGITILDAIPGGGGDALFRMSNSGGTNNIYFYSGGDSYFNAGNLGIGTTTPKAKLQVVGAISGSSLHLEGVNLGQQHQLEIFGTNGSWLAGEMYGMAGGTSRGLWNFGGGASNGELTYSTSPNASTYTQRMLVDQSGNMILGAKAAATAKLDVVGTISGSALVINGTSTLNGTVGLRKSNDYLFWGDSNDLIRVDDSPAWLGQNNVMTFGTYDGYFTFRKNQTSRTLLTVGPSSVTTSGAYVIDTDQTSATANLFTITSNAGSNDNLVFRIQANGATFSDNAYSGAGADYAEWFYSSEYQNLNPGDLVCIDTTRPNAVKKCAGASDPNLMGIISTNPAYIGNSVGGTTVNLQGLPIPGYVLVGLIGQVPAKVIVETESGTVMNIKPGDPLTSASTPGFARKALPGESTVGVALEGLEQGQGVINVLISRTNRSLTVDMLDQKVRDNIASLEIGDQITQELQTKLDALNLSDEVRSAVTDLTTSPLQNLQDQVDQLKAVVSSMSGSTQPVSGNQQPATSSALSFTGSLAAQDITSEGTLTVASDTRIGGDLYLEGVLRVASLLVPNGMTIEGDVTTGKLTAASGSVINGLLSVQGDLSVAHNITMGTGSVLTANDLMVKGAMEVLGPITIRGLATFFGDVNIKGTLTLSTKQAGYAEIPTGQTSVNVVFGSGGFLTAPIVTAAPQGRVGSEWWVDHVTASGFVLHADLPVSAAVKFSWLAIPNTQALIATSGSSSLLPFPLDPNGVPTSSNPQWNACIRNIPVFDVDGQPYSCDRYHSANQWEHPDLHIQFVLNTTVTPALLQLPEGYEGTASGPAILPTSSSSSSVSSSESSMPAVAPGAQAGTSSISSSSSTSSSSSVTSESSSSSVSSSSDSSLPAVAPGAQVGASSESSLSSSSSEASSSSTSSESSSSSSSSANPASMGWTGDPVNP